MLGDKSAVATLAVKDLAEAKKFYEDKLGLSPQGGEDGGGQIYKSGSSMIFVYQSQFAGTNKATAVSFGVGDDLDKIVEGLASKGVEFEQYDNIPEVKREGNVHVSGEMRAAWFKDPDDNIINLVNKM